MMKRVTQIGFRVVTVLAALSAFSGNSVAEPSRTGSKIVKVAVQELFVPVGFDNNDEVVVVVDGYLPNSCYKLDAASATVNSATRKITVTQLAREYPGMCRLKMIPFTNTVSVGLLPAGKYKVEASNSHLTERLNVAGSQVSGPDEYFYAPVDSVAILPASSTEQQTAVIEGRFTNSCMTFDEVRVIDSGKTIEVLPIIKLEKSNCRALESHFRKEVALPADLSVGRHLLHVRSLNGHSLNHVFSVLETIQ